MKKSDSPVDLLLKDIISLKRKKTDLPLFIQIANAIIVLIENNSIAVGKYLPGTRHLSETLGVHRKTIVATFEYLQNEGYIETFPNKGSIIIESAHTQVNRHLILPERKSATQTLFPVHTNRILELPENPKNYRIQWTDGTVDERLLPKEILTKKNTHYKDIFLKEDQIKAKAFLEFQLIKYINSEQNLLQNEKNITVFNNEDIATAVVLNVLIQPGDIVITPAINSYKVNMSQQQAGAIIKTIPINENGIDIDQLEKLCKKNIVKLIYVETQGHNPTTIDLPLVKRIALLQFAQKHQIIVLENYIHGTLSYTNTIVPSLYALDEYGIVVHMNSFEKILTQQLASTYILAPQNLIIELEKINHYLNIYPTEFNCQSLAEMIQTQKIRIYIERARKIYKLRRDLFYNYINFELGNKIQMTIPKNGLAFWMQLPWDLHLRKLKSELFEKKIFLPEHCLFQSKEYTALRTGFAHLNESEMEQTINIFKTVIA